MWATKIELTNGINKNTFGVGVPVTREQIAAFIKRYIDYYLILLPTLDTPADNFSDTPSEFAKDAVELMRVTGIVKGVGNGKFDPKANATRAEVAAMLLRFKDALKNSTHGVNIDADKVSKIKLHDVRRLENGYPHEITVTDKEDIEHIVSVINQPIKEVVFLETSGWTYKITLYDSKDNIIISVMICADYYTKRGYFYYGEQGAFKPIINYIQAH